MWERLAAAAAELDRAAVLRRILDRAARASALSDWTALNDWSLKRQVPDAGSSLALDDDGYIPQLGGMFVSETAIYPAMSAAGNIAAAAEVVNNWRHPDERGRLNMRTTAVLTGCRVALETAALTVWAIGPSDRDTRRKRCAGLVYKEDQNQRGFISCERAIHTTTGNQQLLDSLEMSCKQFEDQDSIVKQVPKANVPNSTQLVKDAARWIHENPPAHATDLLGGDVSFEVLADRTYGLTSGFVHGFKWATWYVRKERELLGAVADSFAAALIMTESAIALFEAQAQQPSGTQRELLYPDLLASTIADWSQRYRVREKAGSVGEMTNFLQRRALNDVD